jgi:hypothetical protein
MTDFSCAANQTRRMVNTFNVPPRDRTAEGWAVVGIVVTLLVMLWLAV